jgi:RNA polymerase sigma factor (sigma-70 family)
LSAADAEEFSSTVRVKLIDRDFAVLRKFQGRSNIATYLTTVIERMCLDFRIARWGKWRPSAVARRLGAVAMMLEQLMTRDGLSFDEAVATLHTNHGVSATRAELHALLIALPLRSARRLGGEDELAESAERAGATDPGFDHAEDHELVGRVEGALIRAVQSLPSHDQLVLKLRYLDDLSVAGTARLLQMEVKPLYRRLEQVFSVLREHLQREQIDSSDIERIVGHPALTLGRVLRHDSASPAVDSVPVRPSKP